MRVGWVGAANSTRAPYWLPGAKLTGVLDLSGQNTRPVGCWISPDGVFVYSLDANTDRVFQYTCSTPWELSTATFTQQGIQHPGYTKTLTFHPAGTSYYILVGSGAYPNNTAIVYQINLSTAWDVSTGTIGNGKDVSPQVAGASVEVGFSPDGLMMFISAASSGGSMWVYILSSSWNIGTATYNLHVSGGNVSANNWDSGFTWSDDGLLTFNGSGYGKTIRTYEYFTPFYPASQTEYSADNFLSIANAIPDLDAVLAMNVFDHGKFALVNVSTTYNQAIPYLLGYQIA